MLSSLVDINWITFSKDGCLSHRLSDMSVNLKTSGWYLSLCVNLSNRTRSRRMMRHRSSLFLFEKSLLSFLLGLNLLFVSSLNNFFKVDLEASWKHLIQSGSLINVSVDKSKMTSFWTLNCISTDCSATCLAFFWLVSTTIFIPNRLNTGRWRRGKVSLSHLHFFINSMISDTIFLWRLFLWALRLLLNGLFLLLDLLFMLRGHLRMMDHLLTLGNLSLR